MMRQREELLKTWLDMWLGQELLPLEAVFTNDVEYFEFQGRRYCGIDQIRRWFTEWNSQNHVTKWQVCRMIHDQYVTMMEFSFQSTNTAGEINEFQGIYLAEWDSNNRIQKLQEFYCKLPYETPYA